MEVVCDAVSQWIWQWIFFRGSEMPWCFAKGTGTVHLALLMNIVPGIISLRSVNVYSSGIHYYT